MAVVMARRKNWGSVRPLVTRAHLRKIKTFSERVTVGMEVAGDPVQPRQKAVKDAAKKFKRSERYVWGTVKLGARMHVSALELLTKGPIGARLMAEAFLLNALRYRPKPAREIEVQARKSGIAVSTLRRACKNFGVKKIRIGGQHGHWIWELPVNVKKSFGIDV